MSATLGGYDIDADGSASWTFIPGPRPFKAAFKMSREAAQAVYDKDEVSLVLDSPGHPTVTVEHLKVLSIQPAEHESRRIVYVSDARYEYAREWVYRTYNLRKRTGDTRLLKQEGVPAQLALFVPDVAYASWSLYPPSAPSTPWGAVGMLIDVVLKVTGQIPIIRGNFTRTLPVESVVIDDSGPDAIDRALSFVPGACMWLNPQGRVVLYDENDKGPEESIIQTGPPIFGPNLARTVSLRKSRPTKIRVLFQRKLEVRFDARSELLVNVNPNRDERYLENVAPICDFQLVVGGKTKSRGTWDLMSSIFTAWAALSDWPAGRPPLTAEEVQKRWLTPRLLDTYSRAPGSKTVRPEIAARINLIFEHYRQTYRIQRFWMERIREWEISRVGLIDEETGSYGQSLVYSDWSAVPSVLGLMEHANDPDALVWNVDGWAALLTNARSAPASIAIKNRDQGIFQLLYQTDKHGYQAEIHPSKVVGPDGTEASIPSLDPRKKGTNGSGLFLEYGRLTPDHRLAVVLTCTPSSPNDERQLYAYDVYPFECATALNLTGAGVGPCDGPVWTIRIGPAVMAAKWEWVDYRAKATEKAFGVGGAPDEEIPELGEPNNARAVRATAIAAAACLMSRFVDRAEGTHVTDIDPNMELAGGAGGVTHEIDRDGVASTTVTFPGKENPIEMAALLPDSIRRQIFGLVQE